MGREIWQSGGREFRVARTPLSAKRALNGAGRYGERVQAGVQLPYGVRIVRRDLGMYRTKGTFAVTGGSEFGPDRGKRVHDTVDEAVAAGFARVEFARSLAQETAAAFPIGSRVEFKDQARYGERWKRVEGEVVGVNERFAAYGRERAGTFGAGYVTVKRPAFRERRLPAKAVKRLG
jgi:hypothetical protein